MIRQSIGTLNGKETIFCQCTTIEEAEKEKLPKGSYFFWEQAGERIFSPGEIMQQVQQSIVSGKFEPAKFMDQRVMRGFYDKVVSSQREAIMNQFQATRKEFADNPMYPKAAVDSIDQAIKFWDDNKMTMPTMEGAVPGAEDAIRGDLK